MSTKLKFSHDEDRHILSAIADQNLNMRELLEEMEKIDGIHDSRYMLSLNAHLSRLVELGTLVKTRSFFAQYYAIAPNILALNKPPYSHESWRALSE